MRERIPFIRFRGLWVFGLWGLTHAALAITELTDPRPWRREAVIEGRTFNYNIESFLHRYSYKPLDGGPEPGEDGISASAGSVTGDQLYVDMRFQQTLLFDHQGWFTFRMQRQEDLDGRFDRQLIGFGAAIGEWRITLFGDVTGDKSRADVQLESDWRLSSRARLRLALMMPEAFFNSKGDETQYYNRRPWGIFAMWQQQFHNWEWRAAVNHFPHVRYQDDALGLELDAEQTHGLFAVRSAISGESYLSLQVDMEQAHRQFDFYGVLQPTADEFERHMHAVTLSWEMPNTPFSPVVELRHFRLKEDGWFGTASDISGRLRRDESMLVFRMKCCGGLRHEWQPAVYLAHVSSSQPERQSDAIIEDSEKQWVGKLALPWRYQLAENGWITITPTVRLHRLAFGGGNVQLHWRF